MREIKFRAWDKNRDRMVFEGGIVGWSDKEVTSGDLLNWFEDEDLMQFTGLKDKNGKDVYEGDILKCKGCYSRDGFYYIDVKFERFDYSEIDHEVVIGCREHEIDFEVVGNIYENPKLLSKISK